jgi:hypothetical protein
VERRSVLLNVVAEQELARVGPREASRQKRADLEPYLVAQPPRVLLAGPPAQAANNLGHPRVRDLVHRELQRYPQQATER